MLARCSCSVASVCALAIACLADSALRLGLPPLGAGLLLGLLVVAVGALHGALWDLAFALVGRLSPALRLAVWSAFAAGLAGLAVAELGALERLGGRYHHLAVSVVLGACTAVPLLIGMLVGMQPSERLPLGWFASRPSAQRWAWVLALSLGGITCFVADRYAFGGLYPRAHVALQIGALWLGTFAIAVAWRVPAWWQRARWSRAIPVVLGVAAVPQGWGVGAQIGTLDTRPWPRLVVDAARLVTDVDLDGYSMWFGGGDCAPWNRAIHPGAVDIPGNGIDDNCMLGDARPESRAATVTVSARHGEAPMDVALITIDSLRPDHMGTYSAAHGATGLATTPALDVLAAQSVVFEHAYTPGGWTSIALSSVLRGVYPRRIEWTGVYETSAFRLVRSTAQRQQGERFTKMFPLPVSDDRETLPMILRRSGVHTVAVVDDEFSELLSPLGAIAPGFEHYVEADHLAAARRNDAGTLELALAELARVEPQQPFFLWVHFFGPHSPNRRHAGVRLDGPGLVEGYDHEVRFVDRQVGGLVDALAARERPVAVFVTADHGEEFIDGERHHGMSLSDAAMRVPLVAHVPGWPSGRSSACVSLIDLMPTILALMGTSPSGDLDGLPLQQVLERGAARRVVLADTWQFDGFGRAIRSLAAATDARETIVFDELRNTWMLSQRGTEPGRAIDPSAGGALALALGRYVEQARGVLQLVD